MEAKTKARKTALQRLLGSATAKAGTGRDVLKQYIDTLGEDVREVTADGFEW